MRHSILLKICFILVISVTVSASIWQVMAQAQIDKMKGGDNRVSVGCQRRYWTDTPCDEMFGYATYDRCWRKCDENKWCWTEYQCDQDTICLENMPCLREQGKPECHE